MRLTPGSVLRLAAATTSLLALASCASGAEQAAPAPPAVPAAQPSTVGAPSSTAATPAPAPATTPARSASAAATAKPSQSAKPAESAKPTPAGPSAPGGPVTQPAPGAKVDCSRLKCIALTFDDGPGKDTPKLLRTLTGEQVVATFFMQGVNIKASPAIARQVADTPGMEVANHTTSHANLPGSSKEKLKREITNNHALLKQTTGRDVTLFRPPYGARNASVDQVAGASGEAVVLWDVDTNDWKTRSASATRDAVRKNARPGSIVLMHDIHASTVNAVPDIVKDLKAEGYTLVTVSQLLGEPAAGKVYTRRD